MLSQSLLVTLCFYVFCLTSLVSAAPRQDNPRFPWASLFSKTRLAPPTKNPLTLNTENSTECNEFPDPGYGGSDPPLYKYWPDVVKVSVACWTESTIAKKSTTYLRTTLGCYVDEESVQAGNKDFQRLLPECTKVRPYQVKTTKNEYLLKKDGFLMDCYDSPKLSSEKIEVQWGARHVWCSVKGETVGGSDLWWRDAHVSGANMTGVASAKWKPETTALEKEHCYVPDDAFDSTVYPVKATAETCTDI